jgi:hypothetical protein
LICPSITIEDSREIVPTFRARGRRTPSASAPAATFRLVINEVGWGGRRPRVVRALVRPGDAAEESRVTPGAGPADEFLAEVFRP